MKLSKKLFIIGLSFATLETFYFGSNLLPGSRSEFICDIISIVIVFIGGLVYIAESGEEINI